ncbi:MAG: glycosyltransferase family 2 protein [Candidatus Uhrbacteria bacterium]|nr:glycosyltransferase family 2 protein [Patescibacteria group bacterium]MBU1907356.1 glycosyltransferase family 2 protein [Patescibacteria group bacterium]
MPKPKVAIVYLSYNSRPYLDEVVLSIEKQTYPRELIKLVIVDNPAEDDSAKYIEKKILPRSGDTLPEIAFFPNGKNEGFAIGNNLGINHALLEGYDYVYLLNNDAKLHSEAIERAVELAESDSQIGSVQSLMLLWQDPDVVNSTGGMIHYLGFGFVRDNGKKLERQALACYSERSNSLKAVAPMHCEIAYASGAAVLYRAELLQRIGAFDEFLWLYHEDLELGWRIRLAGYKNAIATRSICYHHYEFSRSISKWFWMERNRYVVMFTHLHWRTLLLIAPALLLMDLIVWGGSLKSGFIKEKFSSCVDLWRPKTLRNIAAKRRISRESRKVSDCEIMSLYTAKIEHQETNNPIVTHIVNPFFALYWRIIYRFICW